MAAHVQMGPAMAELTEWLWDSLLLFFRLAVVVSALSLIAVGGTAFARFWNGTDPWLAWSIAFWGVLLGGLGWYFWIR